MTRIVHTLAGLSCLAALALSSFGQSPTTSPPVADAAFAAVDVHVSPYRRTPELRASFTGKQYILRDATMSNLIHYAYDQDQKYLIGGPTWLDWNRYDLFALLPPKAAQASIKPMLRTMLADRFKLVTHAETRPLPAYVLTTASGKLKLKKAAPSDDSGCQPKPQNPPPGTVPRVVVSCRNVTMESFTHILRGFSFFHLTDAVVDSTGLTGAWDFDLEFTEKNKLAAAGADAVTLFDAIEKQLGLRLTLGNARARTRSSSSIV